MAGRPNAIVMAVFGAGLLVEIYLASRIHNVLNTMGSIKGGWVPWIFGQDVNGALELIFRVGFPLWALLWVVIFFNADRPKTAIALKLAQLLLLALPLLVDQVELPES